MERPDRKSETELLEALRAVEGIIRQTAWALESALSLERKAWSGYRASEVLGDSAWDREKCAEQVSAASIEAAQLALALAAGEGSPEAHAFKLKDVN